jgi:deazaflavin-dependent oxidoreductase (nitroreductase family)
MVVKLVKLATRAHVVIYRTTRGKVAGSLAGAPVVLVDHVGRKSGKQFTTPVLYLNSGDNLVVIADGNGREVDPAWWRNLKAHPDTTVQTGNKIRHVHAREATATERAELWPAAVTMYPPLVIHQERAKRQIPVVVLEAT